MHDVLAFADLETTGTDEHSGQILEIALVLTDWTLEELTGPHAWLHVPPGGTRHWREAATPEVRAMHDRTDLWADLWELETNGNPQTLDTIDRHLETIIRDVAGDAHVVLAGSGVGHFDRRWIRRHLPRFDDRLAYWPLDTGTIRRFLDRLVGLNIDRPDVPIGLPHRALPDTLQAIEEARLYADTIAQGANALAYLEDRTL